MKANERGERRTIRERDGYFPSFLFFSPFPSNGCVSKERRASRKKNIPAIRKMFHGKGIEAMLDPTMKLRSNVNLASTDGD